MLLMCCHHHHMANYMLMPWVHAMGTPTHLALLHTSFEMTRATPTWTHSRFNRYWIIP